VKPDGPALFKIFVGSANSHGLDESLEGAAAWWPGPPKGTADVLSVSAEHNQINIRYLSGPPPRKGGQIVLHPRPTFALLDREFGFLWGPPGAGKAYTVGPILASYLRQRPQARISLLSTTNWAVDIALLSVDRSLEELERTDPAAHELRQCCKRIGTHFIAANYKGREHYYQSLITILFDGLLSSKQRCRTEVMRQLMPLGKTRLALFEHGYRSPSIRRKWRR
jgi:DNA replication ATP-dependent helicase Dna2